MATKRWFHPNINGAKAEEMLMERGTPGSFLTRPSQNNPGDFTLSVRREHDVTHIRIQNQGDYYDLYGGEKFATLAELIQYYTENPGQLKERNGTVIELGQPLYSDEVTSERWFHGGINGREAEVLIMSKGQDGSYLVRTSAHTPGNYVLSTRVGDEISHVIIRCRDNMFDMGGGPQFRSLSDLIEHYRKTPLVETGGRVINLRSPFHSTSFLPLNIKQRVSELEKQNQDMYGKAGFWEEFEQMQQQETRHLYSRKEGVKPENRPKNRFKNILPFDHTRVILKDGYDPDVPGSDYINANYISGETPDSDCEYIATQGCLPATVNDFWRMVWQEGSLVIVMITNEVERGRNKCSRYWPSPESPEETYGLIHVTSLEEDTANSHYILRHFLVEKRAPDAPEEDGGDEGAYESRHIFQFHFKAWPDHGVPQDPGVVLAFMQDVNMKVQQLRSLNPGPTVVHCSAGIGRTGTYIIIDVIIKLIESQGWDVDIDIQKSVQIARGQRSGMVQTEQQYKFVYRAILHYVEASTQLKQAFSQSSTGTVQTTESLYGNAPEVLQLKRHPEMPPEIPEKPPEIPRRSKPSY
uniref:protein-tyrosine-phosphatase n=1 Tax=Amphimedon queenslandica TaxID=400682 RepID=A0A1X7UMB9_AMPQE